MLHESAIAPVRGTSPNDGRSPVQPHRVDGEEIARQLDAITLEMQDRSLALAAMARLRERLSELSDRAAWLSDAAPRSHLTGRVRELLKRLG